MRSGAVNAGAAFDLRAVASADRSTYAGIVRLVEQAQKEKAPFVRLADRYALIFIPVTLALSGLAWAISGDAGAGALGAGGRHAVPAAAGRADRDRRRDLASRQARHHRQGRWRARDARARSRPAVRQDRDADRWGPPRSPRSTAFGDLEPDEVLRLGASLDQVSPHVLATAIVTAARHRGLELSFPQDVSEEPGSGIRGTVEDRNVALGKASWIAHGEPLPASRTRRSAPHARWRGRRA